MTAEADEQGTGEQPVLIEATGPWPFTTRRLYQHGGQRHLWQSRDNRKGLHGVARLLGARAWTPERLNRWIGGSFTIGASLFIVGSVLSLDGSMAKSLGLSATGVNTVFFVGSIFFTLAAYLQLYQAANAVALPDVRPVLRPFVVIGWQPGDIGWLSCFLQFLGTLLFNVNTYMAVAEHGGWFRQDLTIWGPDVVGSILFLASGYLAFIETCHRFWDWKPASISWWVVFTNLLGCIAFMIAAVYAFIPPGGADPAWVTAGVVWTMIGAFGFLSGAVLMLFES
ncbi:hypothetical protein KHP62_15135 [Rhodobacteraceae bacterium NNCM2]|nr:hypothetical protein [Coraliihabitans acroporae]